MHFEISTPSSLSTFLKVLKTFLLNSPRLFLLPTSSSLLLLQNPFSFSSFDHPHLSLVASFSKDFFSKFNSNGVGAGAGVGVGDAIFFEIDIQPLYKNIYNLRKGLERLEIRVRGKGRRESQGRKDSNLGRREETQWDPNEECFLELFLELRNMTLLRSLKVGVVGNQGGMGDILESFPGERKHRWQKLFSIENEDIPDLSNFRNTPLTLLFQEDKLLLRSVNCQNQSELLLWSKMLKEYSFDKISKILKKKVCMNFEGNKLVNNFSFAKSKEIRKEVEVFVSLDQAEGGQNNIISKVAGRDFLLYWNFVTWNEEKVIKNENESVAPTRISNFSFQDLSTTKINREQTEQKLPNPPLYDQTSTHHVYSCNVKLEPEQNHEFSVPISKAEKNRAISPLKESENFQLKKMKVSQLGSGYETQKSEVSVGFSSLLTTTGVVKKKDYLEKLHNMFK